MKLVKMFVVLMLVCSMMIVGQPAFASGSSTLSVYYNGGFAKMSDTTELYGSHATVFISNDGTEATNPEVTYELYDLNWNLLAEGTLYSDYWVRESDYRKEKTFSGTFDTESAGFYLRIDASFYGLSCFGSATIDVTD